MSAYDPKIVVFSCNWCQRGGADLSAITKECGMTSVKIVKSMCSGEVAPAHILRAFKSGADGVFVVGCPLGDCHYISGNYKARRRVKLMKNVLLQFGIEPERLGIALLSETDLAKFKTALSKFADNVSSLGSISSTKAGVN
jgi:F420-non-reducing hydrogenase iron-sulfur subunit